MKRGEIYLLLEKRVRGQDFLFKNVIIATFIQVPAFERALIRIKYPCAILLYTTLYKRYKLHFEIRTKACVTRFRGPVCRTRHAVTFLSCDRARFPLVRRILSGVIGCDEVGFCSALGLAARENVAFVLRILR